MKKKILAALLATALMMTVFSGCTKKTEDTTSTKKAKTTTVKEDLKTIGTESEDATAVTLTNATGKAIKGVAIKTSDDAAYPANMLTANDVFAKDEKRIVYYVVKADATDTQTEATAEDVANASDEGEKALPIEYTVQLTFEDDTTAELHAFPFESIKEGSLKLEDTLAYVEYKDADKKDVSTLDAEKAVKAQAEAAAAAKEKADADAAAAAAAAQAATDAAAADTSAQQSTDTTQTYSEPAADTTYEEPAATYEEPAATYEEPAADEGSDDDACVGDGLTY